MIPSLIMVSIIFVNHTGKCLGNGLGTVRTRINLAKCRLLTCCCITDITLLCTRCFHSQRTIIGRCACFMGI